MAGMTLSENGLRHLQQSEGSRLKAYQDQAGIWTIGFGHTGTVNGVPIHKGMTITKEQEYELLKQDRARFEDAVNRNVKVPLTQNQFDTLVSFAYNIGDNGFRKSGVLKALNDGNYSHAADKILEYNKSRNPTTKELEFNQGLFNRRKREREMFLGVGEGEAPNIPTPTGFEEHYYDSPILSKPTNIGSQIASMFAPPKADNTFANYVEQMNGNFDQLNQFEHEQPRISNRQKYQQQLADAFGIAPQVGNGLPDYIGDMVRSIYDQTA